MRNLQKPALEETVRSEIGTHAVKTKHDNLWPTNKKEALKKEWLEKRPSFPSDYALQRDLAERILGDLLRAFASSRPRCPPRPG